MHMFVLTLNDEPIGVYSSAELADDARVEHRDKYLAQAAGRALFYRTHLFTVDKKAGW